MNWAMICPHFDCPYFKCGFILTFQCIPAGKMNYLDALFTTIISYITLLLIKKLIWQKGKKMKKEKCKNELMLKQFTDFTITEKKLD